MRERPLIALLLILLTLAVFAEVRDHAFVDFDDVKHIVRNPDAAPGLDPARMLRVFTRPHYGDFVPLTYLSLQLDRTLFGTGPRGTLLVNVALHAASAVLLFLALARMTGATGKSAVVAALFAVHPLRVESVAWAFERKDVLSVFFAVLGVWCYARAVERARGAFPARLGAATICLVASLLSKPMAVTLPFALLLLDHWPLGRLTDRGVWPERGRLAAAIREKWPLFAVSAAAIALTVSGHQSASLPEVARLPFEARLGWALDNYVFYLGKTFWPTELAVFYPTGFAAPPLARVAFAAAVLLAVTIAVLRFAARRPFLWVGWLWTLGTLLPVIGLVQVGMHVRADRYTYLPQIGLLLGLTFGGAELLSRGRVGSRAAAAVALLGVAALAAASWHQVRHWRDTVALFEHALDVTEENFLAHWRLGVAHVQGGRTEPALRHLRASVRIEPRLAQTRFELAQALESAGQREAAFAEYERALALEPGHAGAGSRYGVALVALGRTDQARPLLERSLETDPDLPRAHAALAQVHAAAGREAEAIRHYGEALAREPDYPPALNNLALLLATAETPALRDPERALALVEAALEALGEEPALLDTLAAAQAADGRLADAVATTTRAAALAEARGDAALEAEIRRNLERYRSAR